MAWFIFALVLVYVLSIPLQWKYIFYPLASWTVDRWGPQKND